MFSKKNCILQNEEHGTFEKCKKFPAPADKTPSESTGVFEIGDKLKVAAETRVTEDVTVCTDLCVPEGSVKSSNIQAGVFETYFVDPLPDLCPDPVIRDLVPDAFYDVNTIPLPGYANEVFFGQISEVFTLDTRFMATVDSELNPPGTELYNVALRYPRTGDVSGQAYQLNFSDAKPPVGTNFATYNWLDSNRVPFSLRFDIATWTIEFDLSAGTPSAVSFSQVIPPAGIPLPAGVPGDAYVPPYSGEPPADAQPLVRERVNKVYIRFYSSAPFTESAFSQAFAVLENVEVISTPSSGPVLQSSMLPTFGEDSYWSISNLEGKWEIKGDIVYVNQGPNPADLERVSVRFFCVNEPATICIPATQPTLDSISLRRTYGVGKALVPSPVSAPDVTGLWGSSFALENYPSESGETARVFTVPIRVEFDKEFPACPTVVTTLYSSAENISIVVPAGVLAPEELKAILVSSTVIVDEVTTTGFLCRVHASIVGNNDTAVWTLFKGLVSGGTSADTGGDITIRTLGNTVDFIKLCYHAHA